MPKKAKMKTNNIDIPALLAKPYGRLVTPDVDGSYTAEIIEFPGCFAAGDTAAEALEALEEVAVDWIAAAIEQGQEIPAPLDTAGYSGKLVLRMSKSLHQRAAMFAERDGVSLNQFIVTALAETVGSRSRFMPYAIQFAQTVYAPIVNLQLPHLGKLGAGPTPSFIGAANIPIGAAVATNQINFFSDRELSHA